MECTRQGLLCIKLEFLGIAQNYVLGILGSGGICKQVCVCSGVCVYLCARLGLLGTMGDHVHGVPCTSLWILAAPINFINCSVDSLKFCRELCEESLFLRCAHEECQVVSLGHFTYQLLFLID
jgi:hypothetical protein